MPNASIGGLVSGLDTATIISQLMQLEARPQTMLKSRVSSGEKAVTALQTFNAKLAGIVTKAADLAKAGNWSPMKATSTSDKVSVTATSTASPTAFNVEVTQTAAAYSATYGTGVLKADSVTTATSLTFQFDDSRGTVSVPLTSTKLEDVAAAINNADTGVQAVLVKAGANAAGEATYRLSVTSTTTGADTGFTITDGSTDPLGGLAGSVAARDAEVLVNGALVTSATNSFEDLMPGVTLTLAADAVSSKSTVTIAKDAAAMTESVKAMVEAVNGALSEAESLTAYGADGKGGGLLAGDSTLRDVRNRLISLVTEGVSGQSLASYGIETDRYGKVVFDEAKFKEAYAADPTGTKEAFTARGAAGVGIGFAAKLEDLADTFSDSVDGTVTLSIKSRQSQVNGWEDDIADWDARLLTKENALRRQYTALETALGQLQSQGNWLAGQLAGLPSWNSGQ